MANLPTFSIFTLFRQSDRRSCFGGPSRVHAICSVPSNRDTIEMRVLRLDDTTKPKNESDARLFRRSTFYVDFSADNESSSPATSAYVIEDGTPRIHRAFNSELNISDKSVIARARQLDVQTDPPKIERQLRDDKKDQYLYATEKCMSRQEKYRSMRPTALSQSSDELKPLTQPIPIYQTRKQSQRQDMNESNSSVIGGAVTGREKFRRRRTHCESGFFSSTDSTASSFSNSSASAYASPSTLPSSSSPIGASPLALLEAKAQHHTPTFEINQKSSDTSNITPKSVSSSLRSMLHLHSGVSHHSHLETATGRYYTSTTPRRRTSTISPSMSAVSSSATIPLTDRRASEAPIISSHSRVSTAIPTAATTVDTGYARILHQRCCLRKGFAESTPCAVPNTSSTTHSAGSQLLQTRLCSNDVASPFENYLRDTNTSELHAYGSTQAYLLSLLTPPSSRIVVHDVRSDAAFVYGDSSHNTFAS